MESLNTYKILDAVSANGASEPFFVEGFRHKLAQLASGNNANLVVKFVSSIQQTPPDFGSAQSPTNMWEYMQVKDLQNQTTINGDTGITLAGVDDNRQLEYNDNGARWVGVIVSGYLAGDITIAIKATNT